MLRASMVEVRMLGLGVMLGFGVMLEFGVTVQAFCDWPVRS